MIGVGVVAVGVVCALVVFALHREYFTKRTKAGNPGELNLSVNFSNDTVQPGDQVNAVLKVHATAAQKIIGYKSKIVFDKTALQLDNIEYRFGTQSAGLGQTSADKTIINASGEARLVGETTGSQGYVLNGAVEMANLQFTAQSSSVPSFHVKQSIFYALGQDNRLTELTIPDVQFAPSQKKYEMVQLDFVLSFQGSQVPRTSTQEAKVKMSVIDAQSASISASKLISLNLSQGGLWTGSASVEAELGRSYQILLKGEKHVQRKICGIKPVQGPNQQYRCTNEFLSFSSGVNRIDASGIYLFGGDLPGQFGQDGMVNSVDFALIRFLIQKNPALSQSELFQGDLNFDGVVDTQDYSLMTKTMELSMNQDER